MTPWPGVRYRLRTTRPFKGYSRGLGMRGTVPWMTPPWTHSWTCIQPYTHHRPWISAAPVALHQTHPTLVYLYGVGACVRLEPSRYFTLAAAQQPLATLAIRK